MELDVKELLNCYNTLKKGYTTLEEDQMNLFNNLSSLCGMDWRDGNSIALSRIIDVDRTEADKFRMSVWNRIEVFDFIYGLYSSLGKKIHWNLANKDSVLNSIDQAIANANGVISRLSSIDCSLPYSEFYTLSNMNSAFQNYKSQLSNIRVYFSDMYNKIKEYENQINSKISALEDIKVNPLVFSLVGKKESSSIGILEEANFSIDRNKFELSKDQEFSDFVDLHESFKRLGSFYNSDNVGPFSKSTEVYRTGVSDIFAKRNSYLATFDAVPGLYGQMIQKTIDNFEGADFNE